MWLDRLFGDREIDFARRCRNRMKIGVIIAILGAVTMGAAPLVGNRIAALGQEAGSGGFVPQYYMIWGIALMAAGAAKVFKNGRWLKDPELMKKREVAECDERNRLMGLRCWAYTGYAMFLLLYVGSLAGGFISITVMAVLQMVLSVYAVMLLVFRVLLSRSM